MLAPYRSVVVQTAYFPAPAAEFPNDNPTLHRGARWLCRAGRGAPRAFLDARQLPAALLKAPAESSESGATPPLGAARLAELVRNCRGPLELDVRRVVLPHRVQDIPPPPEFVFEPFVPCPRTSPSAAPALAPLVPSSCRVIDQHESGRRVERRWRVDIAPCLSVGNLAESPAPLAQPLRRRRRALLARGPASVLPNLLELSHALSELEAAFAERPPATAGIRRLPASVGATPATL